DDLEGFLGKLRASSATATTEDRQRVLRAVVQDVLVGPEKITIRHRIPARQPSGGNGGHDTTDTEGDMRESSLLRWGRDHAALRTAAERFAVFPVFQVPGFEHVSDKPEEPLVMDFLRQYHEKDLVIKAAEAVADITLDKPYCSGPGIVYLPQRGMTSSP